VMPMGASVPVHPSSTLHNQADHLSHREA
jgi:hypothetical protein